MPAAFHAVERHRPPRAAARPVEPHHLDRSPPIADLLLGGVSTTVGPGNECGRPLRCPDFAARAGQANAAAAIGDEGIGGAVEHDHRHGLCQVAGRAGFGRHVGDHGCSTCIQLGCLAQHAQGHHATVGNAGDVDAGGIGDATRHQFLVQAPQESHVVAARKLVAARIVPQLVDAFGEDGGETMRGCRLGKTGPARGQISRNSGAVQNDDSRGGRLRGGHDNRGTDAVLGLDLPIVRAGEGLAGNERGQKHEHCYADRASARAECARMTHNVPPCRLAAWGAQCP